MIFTTAKQALLALEIVLKQPKKRHATLSSFGNIQPNFPFSSRSLKDGSQLICYGLRLYVFTRVLRKAHEFFCLLLTSDSGAKILLKLNVNENQFWRNRIEVYKHLIKITFGFSFSSSASKPLIFFNKMDEAG